MIHAQPKGRTRKQLKARKQRGQRKDTAAIRQYVFARERNICRCCRKRQAESLHEILPRGRGGKVSKQNSIATCGQLVGTEQCCHTYLQQNRISVGFRFPSLGAESDIIFTPLAPAPADWMCLPYGDSLISPVMVETERD